MSNKHRALRNDVIHRTAEASWCGPVSIQFCCLVAIVHDDTRVVGRCSRDLTAYFQSSVIAMLHVPGYVDERNFCFVQNSGDKVVGSQVSVDDKGLDDSLGNAVKSTEDEEGERKTRKGDSKILMMCS